MQIVLASSSPYRQSLLKQLGLPFVCANPNIDETAKAEEAAEQLTQRLALAKAKEVAKQFTSSLIIGSDQVCSLKGSILGKPGSHDKAREQLQRCSGEIAEFHTAIALGNTTTGHYLHSHDVFKVQFRELSDAEIEQYLDRDKPYDCAGSFKAESLGIALFASMQGNDFHSLLGLPLISLCTLLRECGINPLLANA